MPAPKKSKREKAADEPTLSTLEEVKMSSRILEHAAEMQSFPAGEGEGGGEGEGEGDDGGGDLDLDLDLDAGKGGASDFEALRRRKRQIFTDVDVDQPSTSQSPQSPPSMPVLTAFSLLCTNDDNTVKLAVIGGMFLIGMCCGVFSGLMIVFKFLWIGLILGLTLLSIMFVPQITDVLFKSLAWFTTTGYWRIRAMTDNRRTDQ